MKKTTQASGLQQTVKIIAGSLRGRKLTFKDTTGCRPTPNRVRETLFNWLAPDIRESTCLDLFAGSGALSFEAISRGAKRVTAVEQNSITVTSLREQASQWELPQLAIVHMDSRLFLKQNPAAYAAPFDIIFLDPPYQSSLLSECFDLLKSQAWLQAGGFIYFESDKALDPSVLPTDWEVIREKKAGQVFFYLAKKQG